MNRKIDYRYKNKNNFCENSVEKSREYSAHDNHLHVTGRSYAQAKEPTQGERKTGLNAQNKILGETLARAFFLIKGKIIDEAVPFLNQVLDQDPDNPIALNNLAAIRVQSTE